MKSLILMTMIFSTSIAYAQKEEKILDMKAHVQKMMMTNDKLFRLELREFAAVYYAEEKFEPCLQAGMKENREVLLKVTALSMKVQECILTEVEKDKAKK